MQERFDDALVTAADKSASNDLRRAEASERRARLLRLYGFTAGEAGERGRAASTRKSRRGEGVSEDDGAECKCSMDVQTFLTTPKLSSGSRRAARSTLVDEHGANGLDA